jgi:hypothetical protein
MKLTTRLAALLAFSSAVTFAATWSGPLVDSNCYAAEERNVNPTDTETFVDRDGGREIRYCSPTHKTKTFAVVAPDGQELNFDSAGNAKAGELVRNVNKRRRLEVVVSGQVSGETIQVDSLSAAPSP